MRRIGYAAAIAAVLAASQAAAKQIVVKVDARSAPWRVAANPRLAFGRNDGRAPALVMPQRLTSGTKVKFRATGETTTVAGGGSFGPDGQDGFITDATTGSSGSFFPSRYIPAAQYPAKLNQLVGAFIDADGRVIGQPFAIGSSGEAMIPEGTMAISLGLNDDIYADNSGALTVTVSYVEGSVTVENN